MGTAASREGRLDSDSEDDDGLDSPQSPSSSERSYHDSDVGTPAPPPRREPTGFSTPDATILMKLGSLTLDGSAATGMKKAKLYQYIQGKCWEEQTNKLTYTVQQQHRSFR